MPAALPLDPEMTLWTREGEVHTHQERLDALIHHSDSEHVRGRADPSSDVLPQRVASCHRGVRTGLRRTTSLSRT